MKPTTLLLAASLVANIALVGVFLTSRPSASAPTTARSTTGEKSSSASHAATAASEANAQSADPARDAALGRAFARFAEKMRAAQAASANDGKWWRNRNGSGSNLSREQMVQARRELADAMIAAFGEDLGLGSYGTGEFSFLSAEKRDKLRGILGDYDELMMKFGTQGGIQLASDKEKLKLLNAERKRDIAALLSPEEFAEYEMRTSPTAGTLRNRYGDGIASEEDFKKLYALQKAYDDKFSGENFTGRVTPEAMKARNDAALQLQADMRAALGEEAYAALKRASDSDLKQVEALASRLGLAPDTTERVAATRDSYAAESQRIMNDASIPYPQRREQLQALAARAKSDLAATLGTEAADAYAQRSQWMSMLQSGMGYSTTPTANSPGALTLSGGVGPSVYPVMPAGGGGSGGPVGVRQVVNMVSSTGASAPGSGAVFFSGAPAGSTDTQVFSISTGTTEVRGPVVDTVMTVVAPGTGTASTPTSAPAQTAPTPKP